MSKAYIMWMSNSNFIEYQSYCRKKGNLAVIGPNIIDLIWLIRRSIRSKLFWAKSYKIKILVSMVRDFSKHKGIINTQKALIERST